MWNKKIPKDTDKSDYNINIGASLDCPRTENNEIASHVYASKGDALTGLRTIAASMVCKTCVFSKLTPLEVEQQRTQAANLKAERLRAEVETVKLETERQQILALGHEALRQIEASQQLPPAEQ